MELNPQNCFFLWISSSADYKKFITFLIGVFSQRYFSSTLSSTPT